MGYALGVVGFIHGDWFQSGSTKVSTGVAGHIGVRTVDHRVGVVWFVRGRWVHLGAPGGRRVLPGSLGSLWCAIGIDGGIRGRWILWNASGCSRVARFIGRRHWGGPVRRGSLKYALGIVGCCLVHCGAL